MTQPAARGQPADTGMTGRPDVRRALISIVAFAIWVSVTAFLAQLWAPSHGHRSLDASVSGAVQPSFAAAILFLVAVIALFRWRDVGLNAPRSARSLLLLWFPGLYVLAFVGLAVMTGLPPTHAIWIILVNTGMAGISEELACRGVLYQGLRGAIRIWPAILISTGLFGAVHLLNGFSTGHFGAAAIQAIAAFMTGMAFLAIRIRTGSLLPGMILHGLWDFVLILSVTAASTRSVAGEPLSLGLWFSLLPLLFVLPNFLYGLFLLRHVSRINAPAV